MCEYGAHQAACRGLAGLIDSLITALFNLRIYTSGSRQVRVPVREFVDSLRILLAESGKTELDLLFLDGFVVVDGRPQVGLSAAASNLQTLIERCHGGGLRFGANLDAAELERFLVTANRLHPANLLAPQRGLTAAGISNATILACPRSEEHGAERATISARGLPIDHEGIRLHRSLFSTLQECAVDVSSGRALSWNDARTNIESILEHLQARPGGLMQAALYEQYDSFTFGHSVRVALIATNVAQHYVDNSDDLVRIGTAAMLHDIGKVRLPFDLLHHSGALNAVQRRQMERHAEFGAELLLSSADFDPLAVRSALSHHRGGGRGYPRTTAEAPISAAIRLIKICDVYEALTAPRPYKAPMSTAAAFHLMLSMDSAIDLGMLREFIVRIGVYPDGSRVVLNDGAPASVMRQTGNLLKPRVLIDDEDEEIDLRDTTRQVAGFEPAARS
jgi:putative nucleotidyltransferase with HDIG domain